MTHRLDVACSRELAARWCALAERRLAHLTELFESGRWRRYYTDQALLNDIRNAKAAVQTWHALSLDPPAPSVRPRPAPVPEPVPVAPSRPIAWATPRRAEHQPIALAPLFESVLGESEIIVPAEITVPEEVVEPILTSAAPRIDMAALEQALRVGIDADDEEPLVDLDAIERRYPALAVAF